MTAWASQDRCLNCSWEGDRLYKPCAACWKAAQNMEKGRWVIGEQAQAAVAAVPKLTYKHAFIGQGGGPHRCRFICRKCGCSTDADITSKMLDGCNTVHALKEQLDSVLLALWNYANARPWGGTAPTFMQLKTAKEIQAVVRNEDLDYMQYLRSHDKP